MLVQPAPGDVGAQTPGITPSTYMLRQFTTGDGLPANFLNFVFQSRSGYVWIGSGSGLTRFDGNEMVTFSAASTPGWTGSSDIHDVCEDQDGSIWMMTGSNGNFWVHLLRAPDRNGDIIPIHEDRSLRIFCLDNEGVAYFSRRTLKMGPGIDNLQSYQLPAPFAGKDAVVAFADGNNGLWMGTRGIVVRMQDGVVQQEIIVEGEVRAIRRDNAGQLLAVIDNAVYTLENGNFKRANGPFKELRLVTAFDSDAIWVNRADRVERVTSSDVQTIPFTHNGVRYTNLKTIFNIDGRRFGNWSVTGLESRLLQLQEDGGWKSVGLEAYGVKVVNWMANDHEGGVWAATDMGLFHIVPRKVEVYTVNEGLADWQVFAIGKDTGENIWVSPWGDGVQVLRGDRWSQLTTEDGLPQDFVLSFEAEQDGSMLVGTNGGVARIKAGRVVASYPYAEPAVRGNPYTKDLLRDRHGRLWVATDVNLFELKDGKYHPVWPDRPVSTMSLYEDSKGNLLAGTRLGVFEEPGSGSWQKIDEAALNGDLVQDFHEDFLGNMWFSMERGGLVRRGERGYFRYTTAHGLPSEKIHFALNDDNGCLWIGSDRGLARVPYASLEAVYAGEASALEGIQLITEEDGLPSSELIAGPSTALKTADGRLWFATTGGLAVVDPAHMVWNTYVPKVYIQQFFVQGQVQEDTGDHAFKTGPKNTFTFNFATLSFRVSSRNRYRYRLRGYEEAWTTTAKNEISYSGLEPGTYVFEVYGSNSDELWSSQPAQRTFTVLPVYYQTYWFWIVVGGGVVCFLWLWIRQIQIRNALRIALVRNRIADDLHDDIGSKLIALSQTLGFIKDKPGLTDRDLGVLGKMAGIAEELVGDLRDSVWSVDYKKDTLRHLVDRMHAFAGTLALSNDVSFVCPKEMPEISLAMEWRRNVYLIFKEALNNAVRHNRQPEITIHIYMQGNVFSVIIADNGAGFDGMTIKGGRGLLSMQRRAAAIGAALKIGRGENGGVRVALDARVPV